MHAASLQAAGDLRADILRHTSAPLRQSVLRWNEQLGVVLNDSNARMGIDFKLVFGVLRLPDDSIATSRRHISSLVLFGDLFQQLPVLFGPEADAVNCGSAIGRTYGS